MFKKVLVDLHAEIDMPRNYFYRGNLEEEAKALEREAKELTEFIRDHRSRDSYSIEIVREYKTICEFCGLAEEHYDNGEPVCCDKAQKEWEEKQKTWKA